MPQVSQILRMRPMSPTDAKKSSSVVAWRLAATAPCRLHTVSTFVKVCKMPYKPRHKYPAIASLYITLFEGHLRPVIGLEFCITGTAMSTGVYLWCFFSASES